MFKPPSHTSAQPIGGMVFLGKGSNSCRKQRRVVRRSVAEAIAIEA